MGTCIGFKKLGSAWAQPLGWDAWLTPENALSRCILPCQIWSFWVRQHAQTCRDQPEKLGCLCHALKCIIIGRLEVKWNVAVVLNVNICLALLFGIHMFWVYRTCDVVFYCELRKDRKCIKWTHNGSLDRVCMYFISWIVPITLEQTMQWTCITFITVFYVSTQMWSRGACACNIVYICSAWVQTYCYSQFWFCLPSNLPCVWTEAND